MPLNIWYDMALAVLWDYELRQSPTSVETYTSRDKSSPFPSEALWWLCSMNRRDRSHRSLGFSESCVIYILPSYEFCDTDSPWLLIHSQPRADWRRRTPGWGQLSRKNLEVIIELVLVALTIPLSVLGWLRLVLLLNEATELNNDCKWLTEL